jgi:hypothetical protein
VAFPVKADAQRGTPPYVLKRLFSLMKMNASSRSFLMAGTHRPHRARQPKPA